MTRWLTFVALVGAGCHKLDQQAPIEAAVKEVHITPQAQSDVGHKSEHKAGPTTLCEATRTEAKKLYQQRCSLCHGKQGRGDGIAAVNLRPSPRSLCDEAWQRTASDADIAAIVVKGGGAVGKSLMMPANNDLGDRPDILAAMVELIRSFSGG